MDDVIYLLISQDCFDVAAQLKRSQCTRSLGLGYKMCAVTPVSGQRTHVATFRVLKVTSQVATPGAESVVHDCLVVRCSDAAAGVNAD